MGSILSKPSLLKAGIAACVLFVTCSAATAQTATVQLTASPQSIVLPDGQSVPMWGYTCGDAAAQPPGVAGSASVNAACTALNGTAQAGGANWQPPLIKVPAGTSLTINLVNRLSFGSGAAQNVPTSLVIDGQVGGGLGGTPARMPSPTHAPQGTTWPGTSGTADPSACTSPDPLAAGAAGTFCPPAQSDRVRSFGTEVAVGTTATSLCWGDLCGTNTPPLRPGTYLIHSGTQPSIQHPMGLYGVLVVADPAATPTAPNAYATPYDSEVPLLFSEIDPAQNREVAQVVLNAAFSDTRVWDGQSGGCGDLTQPATAHTCYPPAVNYSPLYYLVNGAPFDRSSANATAAAAAVPVAANTGSVLLRLVNAGLRLHVPAVVNKTMTLLAEDGNRIPGTPRVQASVALAAGKTYDVTVQPSRIAGTSGNYSDATLAVYDRQLSLSTANQRDGGMQAYIKVANGAATGGGASSSATAAQANPDSYFLLPGGTLTISDPARGLLANDVGIYGVAISGATPAGLALNPNGTFTYASAAPVTFSYCGNGATSGAACATVSLNSCTGSCLAAAPVASDVAFTSNIASRFNSPPPGLFASVTNASGLALTANPATDVTGGTVTVNPDGSFVAAPACAATTAGCTGASTVTFKYSVANAQKASSNAANVTVSFLAPTGLIVNVWDAPSTQQIDPATRTINKVAVTDYRWIIEEDRTFWIDPKCQINSTGARTDSRGQACPPLPVESLGYNFHTAHMPVVAQGCFGPISCEQGQTQGSTPVACDLGNGICRTGVDQKSPLKPGDVALDPNRRYFISILPGDGVNPTIGGAGGPDANGKPFSIAAACGRFAGPTGAWEPGGASAMCGHAMGGSQIAAGQKQVDIALQETPLPTAKIAVFVFQDDNPLNGENDAGGGVDVIAPNEPGLGGFEVKLFDQAGALGDATGQITYDMFNQPVSNALANKMDPVTGLDACPINIRGDGLVGMIPTCPKYESDGVTPSPLAGQVVIANLYPGLYEIVATPAADRVARGEEWLQTNTLDGGKPHEAFIKPNEPGYFQEFGPGSFHVSIGFANPALINARKAGYCNSSINANQPCNNTLNVQVTNTHMSRTPDQRTFSSETYDHYSFTQCYVSVGPADGEDFAFQKCSPDGKVSFAGMPSGVFKITVFDQWNDIMLDGLVGTVSVNAGGGVTEKTFPVTQWRTNLFTRTFIDTNGDGVSQDNEPGLALVNTNIHYRDGSIGFFNNTDLNGYAGFNEVFPFMNWLVVETSSTRFKPTGVHTVYDGGGPVDCSAQAGGRCTTIAANIANTDVRVPLPQDLRIPGAKYCHTADCLTGDSGDGASTGTVFPPQAWGTTQGWQGLLGQNSFIEFGVKPFKPATASMPAENGGISGMVVYASTRPFDDPALSLQLSWEPGVPRVKVNLYSKSIDASGNEVLKLVDTTTTASWDDWTQGFRATASGALVPNISCPGQAANSPFFQTLKDSKQWLDPARNPLPYHSQFKCYDGWSQLNQVQPAPYDGLYKFPSTRTVDPGTGKPAQTNCTVCVPNPDDGNPMLPAGTYVVEVILPTGYELVKEEDKNILLGDVYIAPVTQQFAGFGNIYILPDQAAVNASYNPVNPGGLDKTTDLGAKPRHEGDTGSVEQFWPCVGAERIVPDLNSLYPGAGQAAPFAGARRRLCDRKEVTLQDEGAALTKFFIFSSTHIAGHFTGTITNDFASEFDPFSPQFGEKFGPPNLPVGMRDFTGNEVARVYSDQWGIYNGLYFSSYSVNPPNPTGYVPQMSIACMNDPGPIPRTDANGNYVDAAGGIVASKYDAAMVTDPSYNAAYSNFCYETPFMPGFTAYMDTPVIPTQAFADGYNLPDSEYPDLTPAIATVTSSAAAGPWVRSATAAAAASATVTFTGVSANDTVNSVTAGATTLTSGASTCNAASACSALNQTGRNNRMATLVAASIASRSSTTGVTATASNNTVTLTATATGASLNGTALTLNQSGVTVGGTLAFAGGADASTAALDLTITALGDKVVQNPAFSGPNATNAPYNQKTITRHYGFGGTAGTVALIGSDGVARPLTGVSWSDTTITGTVPAGLPNCAVQQRGQPVAQCGQLVITRGDNGKQSIDAITVTVGGRAPWIVAPTGVTAPAGQSVKDYGSAFGRMDASPLQVALDSADPGDLILVQPGTYRENLIMWKPVRLQGAGAGAVTINADAHPAGKMDQWRRQVACLFGLTIDGATNPNNASFDSSGTYTCPASMHLRSDRIPFEAFVGWDAAGNGNLAQVLQEPTLMGAYEGAGVSVLGRGVRIPATSNDLWGQGTAGVPGAFPDGSVYLGAGSADCASNPALTNGRDYGTANFLCNPSRIDGISVINSSQGGGAIFMHGWNHQLEIANTRISANHGTLSGGINVGNGETPPLFVNDGTICGAGVAAPAPLCPPTGSASLIGAGTPPLNGAIPYQLNVKVHVHHNMIINNASIGDALFSGTPSGAGGVTVNAGADNYQLDHNWIAGNLSTGDGGGLQHVGLSYNGRIDHNWVLFNQSTNPTLPTSGGGISVVGAQSDRTLANGVECGTTTDTDCPPGIGDGTGPNLVIDANLILGNSAESGTGGGLRLQQVNGSELAAFPLLSGRWYDVTVTNNIIANNVAGWDGGGVSLQDALRVTFANNTVASNDTTASAGVLFKTLGAINAANTPPGCTPTPDPTLPQNPNCLSQDAPHVPQPAGLVAQAHTPNLVDAIAAVTPVAGVRVLCPGVSLTTNQYGYTGLLGANGDCMQLSKPRMVNDLFWQNRAFRVDIVGTGTGNLSQQNLVALSPALTQTSTGQCPSGANYWDVGLRTDDLLAGTVPTGTKLTLNNSLYTADTQNVIVGSGNRVGGGTPIQGQFCNGARMPPEHCSDAGIDQNSPSCKGFNAPPGASETTGLTTLFVFNGIQPTATVDEGHNWLNLTYGPLTLGRSATIGFAPEKTVLRNATGSAGGAYTIAGDSAAINGGSTSTGIAQLGTDYFGNTRGGRNDIGAVQFAGTLSAAAASVSPGALAFGNWAVGTASSVLNVTVSNTGTTGLAGMTYGGVAAPFSRVTTGTFPAGAPNCAATLAAGASCTLKLQFAPTAASASSGTLTIASTTAGAAITPATVSLTGAGVANRSTVSISAPTITLPAGALTGTGLVTFTNTALAGSSQVNVTNTTVSGGRLLTYNFIAVAGGDGCTGVPLAPGASCTVSVRFTNVGSARGSNRTGTITFTDTGVGSPQSATLTGYATP